MRIAVPVWQDRISPVFDVAGQLLLVDVSDGREVTRRAEMLIEARPEARIVQLLSLGVETLICGGISQPLELRLADQGIHVIARVCGNVEEILAAFLAGQLGETRFAMPGCCGQRRWRMGRQGCQRGRHRGRKES
ncbi:MAG: hypothetical protein GX621_14590 [Pirellulaceae bacterium]|nr:hypothetical protein [Pirellulaceae bacterium]